MTGVPDVCSSDLRRLFHAAFASEDSKEGMDAFINKRKAVFKHR